MAQKEALRSPSGPLAERFQKLAVVQGLIKPEHASLMSPEDYKILQEGGKEAETKRAHLAEEANKAAETGVKSRAERESERYNKDYLDYLRNKDAGAAPKENAAKQKLLADAEAQYQQILRNGKEASDQIDKTGTHTLAGPENAEQERRYLNLAQAHSRLANPGSAGAGRESSIKLSRNLLPPTGAQLEKGVWNGLVDHTGAMLTRPETAKAQLQGFIKDARDKRNELYRANGLTPPPTPGEKVPVISPEGRPGFVPAEKLEAALAKGFKRG